MSKAGAKRPKRLQAKEAAEEDEFLDILHEDGYEIPLVCHTPLEFYSVFSVLFWPHYNSLEEGIMRFFSMYTRITGPISLWRESFGLRAQAANVFDRRDLVDSDFVHFRGLRTLNMTSCRGVSDAAFANLRGISALNMTCCY